MRWAFSCTFCTEHTDHTYILTTHIQGKIDDGSKWQEAPGWLNFPEQEREQQAEAPSDACKGAIKAHEKKPQPSSIKTLGLNQWQCEHSCAWAKKVRKTEVMACTWAKEGSHDVMLQQCWLTLQATDFPQQTNGWTVWHEKCLLNAGRHTPPPPPGLNVMVAFLSVASATETHKNCRMCLWPQLLFFGAQQQRMTHSFLHGVCNDVWLLACCKDHHWNSLGWEGHLFFTLCIPPAEVVTSSRNCHERMSHNVTRHALLECWQWNVSLQSLQHM